MPGDENKPLKSIFKALTTHLGLLKGRVSELSTYLDDSEADQTVSDHEIDTIQLKARWIETKFNKILAQWEEFLDTDYDEAEHARAEPIYNECDDLSSRIRNRADKFIREKRSRTAQAASGQVIQTSGYNGPPRTNDMLKPKKLLEENMSLEAALHWLCNLALVAHAVTQAIGGMELEDGLRTVRRPKRLHGHCGVCISPTVMLKPPLGDGMALGVG